MIFLSSRNIDLMRRLAFASFALIPSLLLPFSHGRAVAIPAPQTAAGCSAVGRVIWTQNLLRESGAWQRNNDLLCANERLRQANSAIAKMKLFCYAFSEELILSGNRIDLAQHCPEESSLQRRCTYANQSQCKWKRGNTDYVTLIAPFSSTLIENRPLLKWEPISKATSYTVNFYEGKRLLWTTRLKSTTLAYPDNAESLRPGKAYRVRVIATSKDNATLSINTSTLNMLPSDRLARVQRAIALINSLNLPPDQAAADIDRIYMAQNLVTESIQVLDRRIQAGSQNPAIYRLLGDRYMNAGLPAISEKFYRQAEVIAQAQRNGQEVKNARAGLNEIAQLYRQFPTSKNGDQ